VGENTLPALLMNGH